MRIDDLELGGKELGPVRFRLYGDKDLAQQYAGIGRTLLGSHKQKMQLGGIEAQYLDINLPDGTRIRVSSNMIGLAHIDEIWIAPTSVTSTNSGTSKCIGYIIQGTASEGSSNNNYYQYYDFSVETPASERLGYDAESGIVPGHGLWNAPVPHFPDNGARYLPRDITDFQEVLTSAIEFRIEYAYEGAFVARVIGSATLPPLATGYTWVDNNATLSVFPYHEVSPYTALDGTQFFSDHVPVYGALSGEGSPTNPWDGTGLDSTSWNIALANYTNYRVALSEVPLVNAVNASDYAYQIANDYVNNTVTNYRTLTSHTANPDPSFTTDDVAYRRTDKNGYVVQMGFHLDNGFVLSSRAETDGDGAIFMIPLTDKKVFRYSETVFNENSTSTTPSVDHFLAGGHTSVDITAYAANDTRFDSPSTSYNVVQTYTEVLVTTDKFAVPIKVEEGVHKVKVRRNIQDAPLKTKITVWLLFENEGFRKVNFDNLTFASTKYELSKLFKIRVGGIIDNINDFPTLVSIEDHTPEQ